MSKSFQIFFLMALMFSTVSGTSWARRGAQHSQYRWERLSVVQALPSQVFAKLGLTHTTRYGFTRDGHTKKTPDPTFPVGLTDVVPSDADHLLLVRGTSEGLADFRARVVATENAIVTSGRWHVTVELLPSQEAAVGRTGEAPIVQDVTADTPFTVTFGARAYQLRLRVSPNATLAVVCQSGLLLAAPMASRTVWTPAQIWAPGVSQAVPPGGTVLFDDAAAARSAARQKVGLPEEPTPTDCQVRVTVAPLSPPAVPARAIEPVAPVSITPPVPSEESPTRF